MIESIFENMTPHIVNGKKLYDENEIKKAVSKLVKQIYSPDNKYSPEAIKKQIEEYYAH